MGFHAAALAAARLSFFEVVIVAAAFGVCLCAASWAYVIARASAVRPRRNAHEHKPARATSS